MQHLGLEPTTLALGFSERKRLKLLLAVHNQQRDNLPPALLRKEFFGWTW